MKGWLFINNPTWGVYITIHKSTINQLKEKRQTFNYVTYYIKPVTGYTKLLASKKSSNRGDACNRSKYFFIINIICLSGTFFHYTNFVSLNRSIRKSIYFIYPFSSYKRLIKRGSTRSHVWLLFPLMLVIPLS